MKMRGKKRFYFCPRLDGISPQPLPYFRISGLSAGPRTTSTRRPGNFFIHPATASCLARYAKQFEKRERPRVLDPFCGCGSLLFARESLGPCRVLVGVDKSGTAVESARVNARAGKSKASFVTKDALRFEAREGFDLILSNLPFGNRVGNHEDNTRLYDRFVRRLPELLSPGGTAVLYTMEYTLLKSCLDRAKGLTLRERKRTEAGGLLPWIFVVDREETH